MNKYIIISASLLFIIAIVVAVKTLIGYSLLESDLYEWMSLEGLNDAKVFYEKGYPEIKQLATQLLTLSSTILIFSITFSDKIVKLREASSSSVFLLISSWIFLIAALILDGFGIAFNAQAYGIALEDDFDLQHYGSTENYFYNAAGKSLFCIMLGGFFFILSLFSIITSGIMEYINHFMNKGIASKDPLAG